MMKLVYPKTKRPGAKRAPSNAKHGRAADKSRPGPRSSLTP